MGACPVETNIAHEKSFYYEAGTVGAKVATLKACLSSLGKKSGWMRDTEPPENLGSGLVRGRAQHKPRRIGKLIG